MQWPGGGPERSDVVTFEIDVEDKEGPAVLVLAAHGSASLRAARVVVTAPDDWSVRWEDKAIEGPPESIGTTRDGRGLWLAERSVLVDSTDGACSIASKQAWTRSYATESGLTAARRKASMAQTIYRCSRTRQR